jgi:voltage-gated potassium channel
MKHQMRHNLYRVLDTRVFHSGYSKILKLFWMLVIGLNILGQIISTDPRIEPEAIERLQLFQMLSLSLFTLEWGLRLWVLPEHPDWPRHHHNPDKTNSPEKSGPKQAGRLPFILSFLTSPLILLDLAVILPLLVTVTMGLNCLWLDLRFLRIIRLLELSLAFKTVRQSESVKTLLHVIRSKKIDVLMTVCVALSVLLIGSGCMYFLERDAQPNSFGTFPKALWWGVITISTIGYGDVHPITTMGKIVGCIMAFCAIGIIALPAGVFSSIFAEEIRQIHQRRQHHQADHTCPSCGHHWEI